MLSVLLLALLSFSAGAIDKDIEPDSCETPEKCIAKIFEVFDRDSTPGQYPSMPEQAIIKKLTLFKDDGLPFIINLLEEDNELIARIGAVALREVESIDEKFLPKIIAGLDRDISWLAPSLAKVGTPNAAEVAVKKYLVSRSAPHNQEGYAVRLFGQSVLPYIIKAIHCEYKCNDDTYYLLGSALEDMADNDKTEAAKKLINVALAPSVDEEIKIGALQVISFLGEAGKLIEPQILDLRNNEQNFIRAANEALIGIKSKHAGEIYAKALAEGADIYILRDIAELGQNAVGAGAAVTQLLDSDDMDVKLFAARTIGYIGYKNAEHKLVTLLNDKTDVQINFVAAESLGRIKSKDALSSLKVVAENHWYPAVRSAALKAIEHIGNGQAYESEFHRKNFAFEYFHFQHMDIKACDEVTLETVAEPASQKLYSQNASEQLEKLTYKSVILSYGASDEEQQKADNPGGIIEVNSHNIIEHRQEIVQVPRVALKVANGWLVGSDRGEWGGELVHIADDGEQTNLLDENIEDIYKLGERYIATTGLAHLTMNDGLIYELHVDGRGNWKSKPWLRLPGSAYSSWFVETGELLINTSGGGSLLLSETGSFRMATCK
ncbi:HEAT repeat domain-containing protein [Thalassotalea ponticola]|uniref:HEAT repeat domain-containing protein n=1 Tax=Thalassotalea ponticola TaxID=1523392 RepID=UPI0025B2B95E|nr:HEAT repeat domain-containing protein [Thalassotalea ponticola]MDN3652951.1 HEAT repeat domain-containing protein [Thalassotalea ponticola]